MQHLISHVIKNKWNETFASETEINLSLDFFLEKLNCQSWIREFHRSCRSYFRNERDLFSRYGGCGVVKIHLPVNSLFQVRRQIVVSPVHYPHPKALNFTRSLNVFLALLSPHGSFRSSCGFLLFAYLSFSDPSPFSTSLFDRLDE